MLLPLERFLGAPVLPDNFVLASRLATRITEPGSSHAVNDELLTVRSEAQAAHSPTA
jgi:hypothetical protein